MALPPVIDGPVNPEFLGVPRRVNADAIAKQMTFLGWWMLSADVNQTNNQVYRLLSWVEDPEHRFGHALGIGRAEPYNHRRRRAHKFPTYFFKVDRLRKEVVDGPRKLAFDTADQIDEQRKQIASTYDSEELTIVRSVLHKASTSIASVTWQNDVDPSISMGLHAQYMDDLKVMYPEQKEERPVVTSLGRLARRPREPAHDPWDHL